MNLLYMNKKCNGIIPLLYPSISNHTYCNSRGIKTTKDYDTQLPASYFYDNSFLHFKNSVKKCGVTVQNPRLPEDQYLFYHSLRNVKKNYITSQKQFGGDRFNLDEQMSVMLPSSNLESES